MKLHHLFSPPSKKHGNNSCFIPTIVLLAVAILAVANSYFTSMYNYLSSPPSPSRSVAKACNIFRGEWVPDPDAPYYTNDTCSIIHEHYNCMKYGRTDLGFVKWRWRPDDCDLLRFDPARFLDVMRGKSIAFVGDSLARNHMQSLICLLTSVVHPINGSRPYATSYYDTYNVTIANFWAPYLVRYEEIDPDEPIHTRHFNVYLDEPDAVWAAHITDFDCIVVSAMNWFYHPLMLYEAGRLVGCYQCLMDNVTDLTMPYALRMASRAALRAVDGADGRFHGTAMLRTVSLSHYENGQWNTNGNCVMTKPYRSGEKRLDGLMLDFYKAQVEEFAAAERAANGAGVKMMLMDATDAMLLRPDAHPSKYRQRNADAMNNDCVHWCMPGAVDVWNDMLQHMLTQSPY